MLVQSRHITVLGIALHFGEWRTWPRLFWPVLLFNCSQFGRRDCEGAQSAARRLCSSSARLFKLQQRWKRTVSFAPCGLRQQLFPILTWSLKWVMFTELAAHISDTRSCFGKNKTGKKALGEVKKRGKKKKKKIFHSGIFRSGLRHCQRNSLRHNKVLWQGTALWNCPCLMFSSVGFAVELQFCSYLCHIEVHRHTDCYLWGKSHFGPSSNKVTILWLSAKWWRVRSQAAP